MIPTRHLESPEKRRIGSRERTNAKQAAWGCPGPQGKAKEGGHVE